MAIDTDVTNKYDPIIAAMQAEIDALQAGGSTAPSVIDGEWAKFLSPLYANVAVKTEAEVVTMLQRLRTHLSTL